MIYVCIVFCISFFGSLYNLGYCLRRKMYKRLWRRLNAKDYSKDLYVCVCIGTYILTRRTYTYIVWVYIYSCSLHFRIEKNLQVSRKSRELNERKNLCKNPSSCCCCWYSCCCCCCCLLI